jgi:hypothetical protein
MKVGGDYAVAQLQSIFKPRKRPRTTFAMNRQEEIDRNGEHVFVV